MERIDFKRVPRFINVLFATYGICGLEAPKFLITSRKTNERFLVYTARYELGL